MLKTNKDKFLDAMLLIYCTAKKECHYTPTRFLELIEDHGAVATAKLLVNDSKSSAGFITLWDIKRLDLTVEALIIKEEWRDLFTPEDLKNAKTKLKQYGFEFNN